MRAKRFLSGFLTAVMLLTMYAFSLPAMAEEAELQYGNVFDGSYKEEDITFGSGKWKDWTETTGNTTLITENNDTALYLRVNSGWWTGGTEIRADSPGYGIGRKGFKLTYVMRNGGNGYDDCVLVDNDNKNISGYTIDNSGFFVGHGERGFSTGSPKDEDNNGRLENYLKTVPITNTIGSYKSGTYSYTQGVTVMTITVVNHEADDIYDYPYYTVKYSVTDNSVERELSTVYYSGQVNGFKAFLMKAYNWTAVQYGDLRIDVAYKKENTPVISVDTDYSKELLNGFEEGGTYTVTYTSGNNTVSDTITNASESEKIQEAWFGKELSIVKKGNSDRVTTDSEPCSITVKARPDKPQGITVTNATEINLNDGKIQNIPTGAEISTDNETWSDVETSKTNCSANTIYYIRIKATASDFASANFIASISVGNKVTATFVDGDGKIIGTQAVEANSEMPEYTGETPTKVSSAQYIFTFNNTWQPTLAVISENTTFQAQFESVPRQYTITWKNDDNSVIDTTQVAYGAVPEHTIPTKTVTGYECTFDKWTPTLVAVTGDAEYTASYTSTPRTYNIYFSSDKGTVPEAETYTFGTTKTLPIMVDTDDYHFAGWKLDNTGDIVTEISADTTGDKSYTAYWIAIDDAYKMVSDSNLMFNIDDYHEDNGTNDTSKLTASSADGGAGWSTAVFNEAVSKNSFTFDNAPVHYLGLTNYDITMSEGYGKNSPWTAFRFRCASNSGADFMLYDIDGNAIHGSNYAKSSEGYYIGHGERWTTNDFAKQDNALIDDTVNGNDVTRLKNYLKSELVNSTSLTTGHFNYSENPTDDIVTIVIQNHESGTVSDIPDYVTNSENSSSKDKISEGTYTGDYYTVKTFKNNVLISTEYYSGYRNGIRYFRHINTWSANYYGDLNCKILYLQFIPCCSKPH